MQKKTDKKPRRKAALQKSGKTMPVPPTEKDVGHGEEVAPARKRQDAHNSREESRT